MNLLPVYILAGGESSRFGSDKARTMLAEKPLVVRITQQVQPIASRVTVVAKRDEQYADLNLRTIGDAVPSLGPMGGLLTALRDLQDDEDWLLLLSCDLLHMETAWIDTLWAHRAKASAIAFRPDYWQPMLGLYHRSVLTEVEQRADSESRSMQRLLNDLQAFAPPLPEDWPKTLQANRPTDLPRSV